MKIVYALLLMGNCCGKDATIQGLWSHIPTEKQCTDRGDKWRSSGEHRAYLCLKRSIGK